MAINQSGESVFENLTVYNKLVGKKIEAGTLSASDGISGISEGILATSKNRVFVSTAGDDTNSGLSADDSVKTIKKAVEIATNSFNETDKKTIYVSSGDYTEQLPIILPKFCAIIGDSLRTVILRPANADTDFFKVREGVMLMNLVFRDNEEGDFTFRYAMSYDDTGGKLVINQSPYALNCSLISTRGRGKNAYSLVAGQWTKGAEQEPRGSFAYVDGNLVDSISSGDTTGGNLESMVFALLSIITPGISIHIDNAAYAQIVNVFGIFNTDHVLCENGGYASITNSATNFGINALRATGFSSVSNTYSQDVGIVTFACASAVGIGSTDFITIAGAATSIPSSQSIVSIVDNGTGDGLKEPNINNLLRFGYDDGETPFTHSGTEFQIRKVSDVRNIVYGGETRDVYDVAISPRLDEYFSGSYTQYSDFDDTSVRQLRPSIVNSSSHTWEYAGSGTDYDALPKNGGFTRELNEQVEEDYGQVYTSGTNELGDFKVGNFVVLKNNTGEVQFTTPIPIAQIDRITFTAGNTNLIITGVENDTSLGGGSPSDNFLVTQRAANVFVSSGTTTITNKTITLGSNTITGTTAEFNTALTDNDFATLAGSETLTNKSISGSNNTLSNIANSSLVNSTISGVSLGSNLNTLTLNTSGTGLSGSQTYNGSSGATFTVTSNATSSNTASTIVARDASGDFSAGTITANSANFSGNVTVLGDLVYENVLNVDSIGIATARAGLRITNGGLQVTGFSTLTGSMSLSGGFYDKDNSSGLVGQILASTGSNQVNWINSSTASVGSATSVSITSEGTNATRYLGFYEDTSGVDNTRIDTNLTYNPSTNILTAGTFSGSGASLTSLNASNLSSGTVPNGRFPSTLPAVSGANLTNLPAGNLTGALPAIDGSALTGIEGVPSGVIVMWSGSIATIPSGWYLCNGANGTPDLRNRFVVAAGTDTNNVWSFNTTTGAETFTSGQSYVGINSTGGSVAHQMTIAEMPSHSHVYSRASSPGGGQDQSGSGSGDAVNHSNNNTTSQGSSHYHENRPPYYALAFIMKS